MLFPRALVKSECKQQQISIFVNKYSALKILHKNCFNIEKIKWTLYKSKIKFIIVIDFILLNETYG